MTNKNANMHKAKKEKNDEFYTQMSDIKAELKHYDKHFEGKKIYCNCDSHDSNFVKYFKHNFERLRLKSFDFTYYDKDTGFGDFRSDESIELLKQSDVVITNPPFSLFRPFMEQLFEYNKKFLIIGNMNATTYKEIFPMFMQDKIWTGINNGAKEYIKPDGSTQKFGNIIWFTNLTYDYQKPDLPLTKSYNPTDYPKYDNYDAINVDKLKDIPYDYEGIMGVPITFILKHNSSQFDIIKFRKGDDNKDLRVNGNDKYMRIAIKRSQFEMVNKISDGKVDGKAKYDRVLIKRNQFEILGIANSARWIGHECYTIIGGKKVYNRILIKRNK